MPEWALEVGAIIAAGAGVYAAIRADLAYMRAKLENLQESAAEAHRRIDGLVNVRGESWQQAKPKRAS